MGKIPYGFGIDNLLVISGIGEKTAEYLVKRGITNTFALANSSPAELDLPISTARKIIYGAHEYCADTIEISTGEALLQEAAARDALTSGSEYLDEILGGGFETQKIYEIYGPQGTGKSNLLHQLVCTAFLPPEKGGLGSGTVFIDTDGTFSYRRLERLAPRFGIGPEQLFNHVIKTHPPTSDILLFLCVEQVEKVAKQVGARLICVDTIASIFRAEYGTEPQGFPERNQKVAKIMHALKLAIQAINGVLVVTNQVEENLYNIGVSWRAWGALWQQDSQVRLRVRLKSWVEGLREFKVEHALDLPPKKCDIYLGDSGFTDEKDRRKKKIHSEVK